MSGIRLTTTITNKGEVKSWFKRLVDALTTKPDTRIKQANDQIIEIMKAYPPERPHQTYIRTGRLGRNWKSNKVGVLKYRITNSTPYAKYVVGNAYGQGQAWMHVGRWNVFRNVVDSIVAFTLPKRIVDDIDMVARRG